MSSTYRDAERASESKVSELELSGLVDEEVLWLRLRRSNGVRIALEMALEMVSNGVGMGFEWR